MVIDTSYPLDNATKLVWELHRELAAPAECLEAITIYLRHRPSDSGWWLRRAQLELLTGAREAARASLATAKTLKLRENRKNPALEKVAEAIRSAKLEPESIERAVKKVEKQRGKKARP